MNESEKRWHHERERYGWELPAKAHWALRLPIVRRIRGVILTTRIEDHYRFWSAMGSIRTGYDEWVIYAIHRGWC